MALETFILVDAVRQHKRVKDYETIQRHAVYHLAIVAFGISTTIAMFASDSFGKSGKWCWITKDSYKLYLGYLPIWISVIGVFILDVSVVRTMIESAKELRRLKANKKKNKMKKQEAPGHVSSQGSVDSASSNGSAISTNASGASGASTPATTPEPEGDNIMEKKMRGVFLRMLFYPLFLLLLFVPGSVTRLAEITNSGDPYTLEFFSICQRFCDPAKGTLNAIMWVFSDGDVRRELSSSLRKLAPSTMKVWWGKKTTAVERSAMVSDDMELSSTDINREGIKAANPFAPFESTTAVESTTAYGHAETKFQIMSENTMERISEEYRYDDV
jgi:hypothetical protein